jgi:hypothetical protein
MHEAREQKSQLMVLEVVLVLHGRVDFRIAAGRRPVASN